ncbi:MAG: hypothetical protein AAF657_30885 [Acidobacteriota bacterium]
MLDMQKAIESAFIAPFASHQWKSARGRSHWVELEGWQDSLAGPLVSIADSGGCGYVYHRKDSYFSAVVDPESLHARLLEWHAGLIAGIEAFCPVTAAEVEDETYMREIADKMLVIVERGCGMETARWAAERGYRTQRR